MSIEYPYTAIVIAKRDIGESDRMYTLYTREAGKIIAVGRGTRKPNAKLAAHLETFSLSSVAVARNRGRGNITSAVREENLGNGDHYEVSRDRFAAAKIVDSVVGLEERDERVFQLLYAYLKTQKAIAAMENAPVRSTFVTNAFLLHLLSLLGYTFETARCVACAGEIDPKKAFTDFSLGGIICKKCVKKKESVRRISPELLKTIRFISQTPLSPLKRVLLEKRHLDELSRFVREWRQWNSG